MSEAISVADAIARYGIDQLLRTDLDDVDSFVFFPAGHRVDGDLDLDGGPVLAAGALEVTGDVLGWEEGSALVVLGDLRANNVLVGGPEIVIKGHLFAKGSVLTDYNHGSLDVAGDLHASLVLAEHLTRIGGRVHGTTVDFGGLRVTSPDFKPTVSRERATRQAREVFVPEVLNDQGYVTGIALKNRLREGLPVLR